jgi:hypothetical protein
VAFSPNGKLLATGSGDNSAKLWDVATGKALQTLPASSKYSVKSVTFSPDGKTLAVAGIGYQLDLWDVSGGAAQPGSTPAPAATAAPRATATAASAKPTTASAGGIGKEKTSTCQIAVPSGFTPLANADDGVWTDQTALLLITPTDMGGKSFADWSATIPDLLASDSSTPGFKAGKVTQQPNRYRLEFTTAANPSGIPPYAATGVLTVTPANASTACVAEFLYPHGQDAQYGALADSTTASLQAVKP